jgi:MFS transporter, YNFM family, putative membrane transport protein
MGIVIYAAVLTISALYAPQPLLPVLAREFSISRDLVALLTTVAMVPLSLAPLLYGYILQSVSARSMLQVSMLLLAISELLFAMAGSFYQLLTLRIFQGLLIPALLTALMTYVSQMANVTNIQRAMGIYIAATILGGFLGRTLSGGLATLFGWRTSFSVLALSMFGCLALLARLQSSSPVAMARPSLELLRNVLRRPLFLRSYLGVFCLFLVFAAMMNFIPFRLTEISQQANSFRIGLIYCGYLMGLISSLLAVWIGRMLGGEIRAMISGFVLFGLALAGFIQPAPLVLFLMMFLFCGTMFLVHATASGWLNKLAGSSKGVVNGLYVAFYYGGGVVGSSLPGLIYHRYGWNGFLLSLAIVAMLGCLLVISAREYARLDVTESVL